MTTKVAQQQGKGMPGKAKSGRKFRFPKIPIDVYIMVTIPLMLVGGAVYGLNKYADDVKKSREEAASFQKEVHEATDGRVQIQYGQPLPAGAETYTAPAAPLDFTLPLSVLGVLAVLGVASYFLFPRIKSALITRRDRKALKLSHAETWTELFRRRDNLMLAWSKYETDIALMIDYPIMTDYTDPVVREVITAMQKMRKTTMMMRNTSSTAAGDSALQDAVDEFEIAFNTAEKYARRYGQTRLDPREQRKLSTARSALNIILDGEAPAFEVEAAYKSLRSSLKGIIDVPDKALMEIEALARRELVAS
jgi:hypothetical protein